MAIIRQGAMIGGTILPEKEFKEVLEKALSNSDYERQMILAIRRCVSALNAESVKKLYDEIEKLQTLLLQNPKTSLMVITNLKTTGITGEYQWYWAAQEGKFLTNKGAIQSINNIKDNLFNQALSEVFSKHLEDLIIAVESDLTNEEIKDYFNNKSYGLTKEEKQKEGSIARTNRNLAYIIYGKPPGNDTLRGQIADAFLNHVGNMHSALITGDYKQIQSYQFSASVKEEEGPHFYRLLHDSKNHAGWQTGGDLILLSGNKIIANIQLKSKKQENDNYVGQLSSSEIAGTIYKLKDFIDKGEIYNKKVFVENFYNLFATSGIVQEVEEKIKELPIEYAKRNLQNIPGITIDFS